MSGSLWINMLPEVTGLWERMIRSCFGNRKSPPAPVDYDSAARNTVNSFNCLKMYAGVMSIRLSPLKTFCRDVYRSLHNSASKQEKCKHNVNVHTKLLVVLFILVIFITSSSALPVTVGTQESRVIPTASYVIGKNSTSEILADETPLLSEVTKTIIRSTKRTGRRRVNARRRNHCRRMCNSGCRIKMPERTPGIPPDQYLFALKSAQYRQRKCIYEWLIIFNAMNKTNLSCPRGCSSI
uniref:uncharacterized protein LOC100175415 isoform X2 n=1 Tax=Ciona intestinalis TaxID=7719 RepID=UPI000EF55597|nr:uncharacterized protein LOC100175415 isoform X2 [Ciona intestinalis]|eukprot:XP_018668787.2 uncharacterized protein LOC100175415 isoform X2 [Ciona intestinalis]